MAKISKQLKLTIELVPEKSWFRSLRDHTDREDWDKIRKQTYDKYEHECGVCGETEGRLSCHETWEYDDKKHLQKLVGLIALCDMCHHVKHMGPARKLADRGKLDYRQVEEHFMKVNNCDKSTLVKHRTESFEQWRKRSKYEWQIDLGEYKNIVNTIHGKKTL